jgi:flavin reductase (DIM6/NTAB) family NADH-FMN oxidoreductase RutF
MLHDDPPLVLFSSGGRKDSARNAEETGVFVVNMVGEPLARQMNATAVDAPPGESEFDYAGLTPVDAQLVAAPRVAEAFAALECRVTKVFSPPTLSGSESGAVLVIGQVVGVHIDERILTNGKVDVAKYRPVARLGYLDFAVVSEVFAMRRPKWSESK